jgi:hypothetical protein
MLRLRFVLTLLVAALTIAGCSTTKTNDYEEPVRAFIDQFEKNLAATDEVIMQPFEASANGRKHYGRGYFESHPRNAKSRAGCGRRCVHGKFYGSHDLTRSCNGAG